MSYSSGFRGFIEEEDSYIFFQFPRSGKLKELLKYNKSEYKNYGHFIGGISKFIPYEFFLKEPMAIESITIAELDRIFEQISDH